MKKKPKTPQATGGLAAAAIASAPRVERKPDPAPSGAESDQPARMKVDEVTGRAAVNAETGLLERETGPRGPWKEGEQEQTADNAVTSVAPEYVAEVNAEAAAAKLERSSESGARTLCTVLKMVMKKMFGDAGVMDDETKEQLMASYRETFKASQIAFPGWMDAVILTATFVGTVAFSEEGQKSVLKLQERFFGKKMLSPVQNETKQAA